MYDGEILSGEIVSIDKPDWKPLEQFVPPALCGGFMWMHRVRLDDGELIEAYKHSETRRYVLLDAHADAWEHLDRGRFRRMRHSDALEQVFDSWWLLEHATDSDKKALRQAFNTAWDRGNGDQAANAHILPSSPACGGRTYASPGRTKAGAVPHGSHSVTVSGKDADTVPVGTLAAMRRATGLDGLR